MKKYIIAVLAVVLLISGCSREKAENILKDFTRILGYLDSSYVEKTCGDIALEVLKNGAYYGYITESSTGLVL